MSNQIKWKFPPNAGGENIGFNNGALDHFKGYPISSTVREVIQNSLDAPKVDASAPIGVQFKIYEIPRESLLAVTSIKEHIEACLDAASEQKIDSAKSYYMKALKRIEEDKTIRFLAIHDYNSKGLLGPTSGNVGSWSALVKGTGISQKEDGSLGSYGHGSKAPFSLSDIRTVFYLTYVKCEDGSVEKRFQGKSILQTHLDPKTDQSTQGTGYYGWEENCSPLLEEQIPEWALKVREDVDSQTGTTILIPYFSMGKSELPEIVITVIANFYYAIAAGNLVVDVVGESLLTRENSKEKYYEYLERLPSERDGIDFDRILSNFQSLESVVDPTHEFSQEIQGFGSYKWFLKILDDDAEKRTRVAIARKEGMLIRHNPKGLERFRLTKSFEMFVCVEGKKGSELLKRVENPRHDDFEFDRLEGDERKKAWGDYTKLTNSIREVIKKYAMLPHEDELRDDTLKDWFAQTSLDLGEGSERSSMLTVSRAKPLIRATKNRQFEPNADGDPSTMTGQGTRGGKGKKKSNSGPVPGPGRGLVTGLGKQSSKAAKFIPLNNLRILTEKGEGYQMKVFFDNPGEGEHQLILEKVGEEGRDRVQLLSPDGGKSDRITMIIGNEPRQEVLIKAGELLAGYKFEAKLVVEEQGGDS